MRLVFLNLFILTALVAGNRTAAAQNYPWCADYSGDFGGENCGFATYEQCMVTIAGIGGSCDRNTQYAPPGGRYSTLVRRRRGHAPQKLAHRRRAPSAQF